jgi:septal ring factor EnvC (AmiA/AmiB activator)
MDAETEFGKRLRATLDAAAKAAAQTVVEERFTKFGSDVVGWAERAARDAVLASMLEAVRPVHAALGRLEGQFAGTEEKLAKQAELLAAVDTARLHNDREELDATQGRLEKARGDILAEIRAASTAVAEEADRVRKLAGNLLTAREDAASLASALAARIEAIHGEVAKAGEEAAAAAMERMKGDFLSEMDAFSESLRGVLADDLKKFRAESAGVLSRARVEVTSSLDAMHKRASDDAGLLLSRFRGPYEEGDAYAKGDIAVFRGSTWIAKRNPKGTAPSADPQGPWALFASGGIGRAT